MHRSDLHLSIPDQDGDRLLVDSEGNETYITVIDSSYDPGRGVVELDDDDLRTIINHLQTILDTRK